MKLNKEIGKNKLTKEQYEIMGKKGTEQAFTGKYLKHKENGNYYCAFCENILFDSKTKFDSGTGWPSFSDAKKGNVILKEDNSGGMKRTEVLCAKCESHLGHVFNDNFTHGNTGMRYCINSACLNFKRKSANFKTP